MLVEMLCEDCGLMQFDKTLPQIRMNDSLVLTIVAAFLPEMRRAHRPNLHHLVCPFSLSIFSGLLVFVSPKPISGDFLHVPGHWNKGPVS